ncbi:MAG: hypothetical protein E7638_00255 [Ruminococcaceae bacterium]|nr:hypothetical protein [Oscillospiraceae bacterium]
MEKVVENPLESELSTADCGKITGKCETRCVFSKKSLWRRCGKGKSGEFSTVGCGKLCREAEKLDPCAEVWYNETKKRRGRLCRGPKEGASI